MPSTFSEPALHRCDSFPYNPELIEKLNKVVFGEDQRKPLLSQGTQTGKNSSSKIDDKEWKKRLESTKRELPASDYFDGNAGRETISRRIKDRFAELSTKYAMEAPEKFKIYVDCEQFESSEVKVSVEDGFLEVRAEHSFKFDDHGLISREFKRRWAIPEDVKKDKIVCFFDRYNILTIQAPRKQTIFSVPVQIQTSKD